VKEHHHSDKGYNASWDQDRSKDNKTGVDRPWVFVGLDGVDPSESKVNRLDDLRYCKDRTDSHPWPDRFVHSKMTDKRNDCEPKDGSKSEESDDCWSWLVVDKPSTDQVVGQPETPKTA
jgi:hypothetical protein